jgi:hypothetical protein
MDEDPTRVQRMIRRARAQNVMRAAVIVGTAVEKRTPRREREDALQEPSG